MDPDAPTPEATQREIASRQHRHHLVLSNKSLARSNRLVGLTMERIEKAERLRQKSQQLRERSEKQIERAKSYRHTATLVRREIPRVA